MWVLGVLKSMIYVSLWKYQYISNADVVTPTEPKSCKLCWSRESKISVDRVS